MIKHAYMYMKLYHDCNETIVNLFKDISIKL